MTNEPEIAIDYTITYAEFAAGSRLGWRQSLLTFLFYIVARYIAFALAVLCLALVIFSFTHGEPQGGRAFLPVTILLFIIPLTLTWTWRRSYNRLKVAKDDQPKLSFAANGQEFVRQIHGMGELTWLWSATKGFAENKKVVLIAARKGAFIIIPRRALSETQIERLRAMQKGTA
jgi:hypothetical protein